MPPEKGWPQSGFTVSLGGEAAGLLILLVVSIGTNLKVFGRSRKARRVREFRGSHELDKRVDLDFNPAKLFQEDFLIQYKFPRVIIRLLNADSSLKGVEA